MLNYYNPADSSATHQFIAAINRLLNHFEKSRSDIILLCIGSDRATGDCLGPIIGHKLQLALGNSFTRLPNKKGLQIYGTLDKPVHAGNLEATIGFIKLCHKDPLIIAVDASLGTNEHIGYITLGKGPLSPGIGVNKSLPKVGDIFITGIVNLSGPANQTMLQTTRLNTVMQLADFVVYGLYHCLIRSQFGSALQSAKQGHLINKF